MTLFELLTRAAARLEDEIMITEEMILLPDRVITDRLRITVEELNQMAHCWKQTGFLDHDLPKAYELGFQERMLAVKEVA